MKKVFSTQNDEEKIIKIANRHPFTYFRDAFLSIFLFIASLVVMIAFFYVPYVLLFSFVLFVFSIIGGFYSYFTWERDKYVITDSRVVDIDQITLFTKTQKEAFLEKIQDVTAETKGFFGTIFKYGNVTIQTAGEISLTLNDVANPEKLQKIIFDLMRDKEKNKPTDEEGLMQKMTEMFKNAIKGSEEDGENKIPLDGGAI